MEIDKLTEEHKILTSSSFLTKPDSEGSSISKQRMSVDCSSNELIL